MANYICLIQFTDQGIRNIKDTVKRGDAAIAEAEKMGMKIVEEFWTMGAYDGVVVFEAPDDETMSAFILKIGALGNVKGQTLRAFRRNEMERDSGEDQIAAVKIPGLTKELTIASSPKDECVRIGGATLSLRHSAFGLVGFIPEAALMEREQHDRCFAILP